MAASVIIWYFKADKTTKIATQTSTGTNNFGDGATYIGGGSTYFPTVVGWKPFDIYSQNTSGSAAGVESHYLGLISGEEFYSNGSSTNYIQILGSGFPRPPYYDPLNPDEAAPTYNVYISVQATFENNLEYFETYADAMARNNMIANQNNKAINYPPVNKINATLYNSISSWRIARYRNLQGNWTSGPYTTFQVNAAPDYTNLQILAPADALYGFALYPPADPTTSITFYQTRQNAISQTPRIAENTGLTISASPIILNANFNSYTTNSWRIAQYWDGGAWVTGTLTTAYSNGTNLTSITSGGALLFPAINVNTGIQYFQTVANANARTNPIAEEPGLVIKAAANILIDGSPFDIITSWRIAKYFNGSSWVTGQPGAYTDGTSLTTVTSGRGVALYPAVPPAVKIQYFQSYNEAMSGTNGDNALADQSTLIIDDSTNVYDLTYYSIRLWGIARYYKDSVSAWIPGPSGVFSLGSDLTSITGGGRCMLYPGNPCFLQGTNILCQIDGEEIYVPIETLKKGALVKISNGEFKKIELIGKGPFKNPGHSERIQQRLYKCSRAKYPELKKDLFITGCHSILVKELTEEQNEQSLKMSGDIFITDESYRLMACIDERAEPWASEGDYTIWHLALENENPTFNYGIYANGLLVESCAINYLKNKSSMEIV